MRQLDDLLDIQQFLTEALQQEDMAPLGIRRRGEHHAGTKTFAGPHPILQIAAKPGAEKGTGTTRKKLMIRACKGNTSRNDKGECVKLGVAGDAESESAHETGRIADKLGTSSFHHYKAAKEHRGAAEVLHKLGFSEKAKAHEAKGAEYQGKAREAEKREKGLIKQHSSNISRVQALAKTGAPAKPAEPAPTPSSTLGRRRAAGTREL